MRARRILAVGVLLGVGALLAAWWPRAGSGSPLAAILPDRCTVGVAGNAVSVTIDGPGAGATCDATAGTNDAGFTWYRYAEGTTPTAAVFCELSIAGVRYTVRDQGLLNLLGTAECDALAKQQAARGP